MCLAVLGCPRGEAQTAGGSPHPAFDAASVKRVPKDMGAFMRGGPGSNDPGRIAYHSTTWYALLMRTFGVKSDQLDVPGWMTNGNYFYDIDATIPPSTTDQQFRAMLLDLLVERFRLVYHRGLKNFPGYELTVAPGGPKIRRSDPHTDDLDGTGASGGSAKEESLTGPKPLVTSDKMLLTARGFPVLTPGRKYAVKGPLVESGIMRATFHESMPEFLEYLPFMVMESNGERGYPRYRIADRTGLEGVFDFTLEFFSRATPEDGGGPSIFQALERQVGLRLNKTKDVEVELIVVDRAERIPTEN
jgi:uncharacterized protein (TIGR03435 family)